MKFDKEPYHKYVYKFWINYSVNNCKYREGSKSSGDVRKI
jgi:hypothetical protein